MADAKQLQKQIKIRTGACNRTVKDYKYYVAESEKEHAKLEQMKAQEEDEGKVRQYEEAYAQTVAMLPQCKVKIPQAKDELQALVEQVAEDDEWRQSEDYQKAVAAVADAQQFYDTI